MQGGMPPGGVTPLKRRDIRAVDGKNSLWHDGRNLLVMFHVGALHHDSGCYWG